MNANAKSSSTPFIPPCSWWDLLRLNPDVPGIAALQAYDGAWFHCSLREVSEVVASYRLLHPRRSRTLFGEQSLAQTAGMQTLFHVLVSTLGQEDRPQNKLSFVKESDRPLINLMTPILARIMAGKIARGDEGLTERDYARLTSAMQQADDLAWLSPESKDSVTALRKAAAYKFCDLVDAREEREKGPRATTTPQTGPSPL